MTRSLIALACALVLAVAPARADFVLNGQGANGVYQVYRVDDDGGYTNPTLILSPGSAGLGAAQVYWPSAVNVDGELNVYATALDNAGAMTLGLWRSTNGITFAPVAHVLTPQTGEGRIGSAHVIYDPADSAAPFKAWFGTDTLALGRPSVIKYATSTNGVNWTRVATVLTASESYEAAGFQLGYVCRDGATWRLFYEATDDAANVFRAAEATAASPAGPFTKRGVVFAPGGSAHVVLSTVMPGSRYLRLDSTAGLQAGAVYVLSNGQVSERVVIERVINGHDASIRDAMVSSGVGFELRTAHYRKVAVSTFYRDEGVGRVLFTGWGAFPVGLSEYVFEGQEIDGAFVRDLAAPPRWKPTGPGSLYSFENPSPITSGPAC